MIAFGGGSFLSRTGLRALSLVLLLVTPSRAEWETSADSAGYVVEYGSSVCGWGDTFEARVERKRQRATEGTPLAVRVSVEETSEGLLASMELRREGSPATTREFRAEDCDEALSALATVVAIALDATVDEAEVEPASVEPAAAATPTRPIHPEDPPPPWVPGAGASLLLDFSMAPQPVVGGSLFGSLRRGTSGLGFRLHAGYRFNDSATTAGHEFGVSWLGGGVEVCPRRFGSEVFSLEPCAGFELGRYRVEANSGFSRSTPRSLLWGAASLVARGGLQLGRGWSWEGAAHLLFPVANQLSLVADSPGTARQISLFRVDPVSVALSTGIKVDFR